MEVVVVATRNVVLSQHQHELVESMVAHGLATFSVSRSED